MAGTLSGWLQKITFGVVTKEVVNFQTREVYVAIPFTGVWQPLDTRKLIMKPEHQRAWTWIQCHSTTNIGLKLDDIVRYQGVQYRVMALWDYLLNGFYEYHLCEDTEGVGPTEEVEGP